MKGPRERTRPTQKSRERRIVGANGRLRETGGARETTEYKNKGHREKEGSSFSERGAVVATLHGANRSQEIWRLR